MFENKDERMELIKKRRSLRSSCERRIRISANSLFHVAFDRACKGQ